MFVYLGFITGLDQTLAALRLIDSLKVCGCG
jgi:hypothetical protein